MVDLLQSVPLVDTHAGELTPQALSAVTITAGVLARIFAPLIAQTEKVQRLLAMATSAAILGLWVYSQNAYSREGLFGLVEAFGEVSMATIGIFVVTAPALLSNAASIATGGRVGTAIPNGTTKP